MSDNSLKQQIIDAGRLAVAELIKVAKEPIIGGIGDDLSADRLKTASQAKRIAIEDSFAILSRIEEEENLLNTKGENSEALSKKGFAERYSKKK